MHSVAAGDDTNPQPHPHPPPPRASHDDDDEDDAYHKQLGLCAKAYLALQDCLVDTNRNWRACQNEVKALKGCHEQQQKQKQKQ